MDGPTIQRATEHAVRAGVSMRDALRAVAAVVDAGAAAVTMGYWNQVERYGVDRFAADLAAGRRVRRDHARPDPGRGRGMDCGCRRGTASTGCSWSRRPRPTRASPTPRRLPRLRLRLRGHGCDRRARERRRRGRDPRRHACANSHPGIPVCVGLGVSTGDQAAQVAGFADGVIVGSALVRCLLDGGGAQAVRELAAELADGVRAAPLSSRQRCGQQAQAMRCSWLYAPLNWSWSPGNVPESAFCQKV